MKTLAVKWRGKWMDFAKYLERFMAEPNFSSTRAFRRTLGDQGWSTLFDWYRDSGRPFRFLELPLELRTMIYASGIGNDIYPKVKEQGIILQDGIIYDMSLGNGWTPEPPFPFLADTDDPDERVACPDKSMTRLCKQTRREVFECAWRSARVNFPNSLRLYKISLIRPQLPTYALNHLGLNFSNLGYLRFLGGDVEVAPGNRDIIDTHTITRSPPAFILIDGRLPNLKKLDIKFRSTRWAQYTNPVTVAHKKAGLYLVFGRGNIPGFCQKKFTLLILNLLLQYTCHIDEVTIEGDVKHSTLQHFRQALAEKKAQGIPGYHGSFYYARDNYFAQYMDSGYVQAQCLQLREACSNVNRTFCYCSKPCMPVDSSLNPPDEVIQQKVRSYQFDFAD
jgi:hypothetical protein